MTQRCLRLLSDILLETSDRTPDRVALDVDGVEYTYAHLRDSASSLARTLHEHGLERGDRIAIYMDNTWVCAVSIFGALLAGGVFLVINPQTKGDKLDFVLRDSGARFLITDAHLSQVFLPVLASNEGLVSVVCSGPIDDFQEKDERILSFEKALEGEVDPDYRSEAISTDLAALIYTSGSTGDPKGIMMSHASMLFAVDSIVEYLRLSPEDRILNFLPFAFDYGLYQLLMSVRLGALLVLEKSFLYPAQIVNCIRDKHVTVFPGVPTVFSMLVGMHRKKPLSFPSIKRVTNTAAALSSESIPLLHEIFPEALIFKMYGLSECKRVSYLEPELLDKYPSSVGKAIPGTEVFVLGPDGKRAAPGEDGILHVRGAHLMRGYWGNPKLSAKMLVDSAIPGERILCTQDRFKMDEQGLLYFVGRSDEIIKTRGEKVSPLEVERVIKAIPGIQDVGVIGVPDDLLGEAIVAFVALDQEVAMKERTIQKHCLAHLENFMVPKTVVILDALPKTATGKVSKLSLAKEYKQ